jgi:ankyrin repeat protein
MKKYLLLMLLCVLCHVGYASHEFISAVIAGNKAAVEKFIKDGIDVNYKFSGRTALILAANKGRKEIVEILLQAGANPDIPHFCGSTALMDVAKEGDVEMVEILLKAKANPDIQDTFDDTALIFAVENNHKETVDILLKAKANPDIQDHSGGTALMLAARNGDKELVEVLLQAKANPDIRDHSGRTAFIYASDRKEIADMLNRQIKVIERNQIVKIRIETTIIEQPLIKSQFLPYDLKQKRKYKRK